MKIVRRLLSFVGPGFITASVVLGPGSITVSSKIGTSHGYSLLWVILAAAAAMGVYTHMAARFGAVSKTSMLQTVADEYGRWFAALIGISCFVMAASFQFGNNLGVATAMHSLTGINESVWPPVFTGAALVLVFFAKRLYKALEALMAALVMTMIVAFLLNLIVAKPDLLAAARGFVPSLPKKGWEEVAALVATTFVLHVAFYQSYLTQSKGWGVNDLKRGFRDTASGIFILSLITVMIVMTSATVLHPRGLQIANAADMARQLEVLFGPFAKTVFSVGLWAAAFSSLAVNMVIGGGLLADGLGLGRTMEARAPRLLAAAGMLIGMVIALYLLTVDRNVVAHLIVAQASTLFAVPAVAIGLFLVANNRKVMGSFANSRAQNGAALFGMALIFLMVYYKYAQLFGLLKKM